MTSLIAYHGDPTAKEDTLAALAEHRRLDQIVQGIYWDDTESKGCAVGCLLHDPEGGHERYETEFGIPEVLAHLEDGIFEALPVDLAKEWPGRFMAAIPVGADLVPVWPRFAVWLMTDPEWGLEHATEAEDVKAVCRQIADAYTRIADGDTLTEEEQKAITGAAWAARDAWDAWAAWAARDAWDAWAAWAAWDAWDAWDAWAARAAWDAWAARAARAAWDAWAARAAWDAWDAWAARAARAAFVSASSDRLIHLLETAPAAKG